MVCMVLISALLWSILLELAMGTLRIGFFRECTPNKCSGKHVWNGFGEIAVPEINRRGGIQIGSELHLVQVYEVLVFERNFTAAVQTARDGMEFFENGTVVPGTAADLILTYSGPVKAEAELAKIPNINCQDGNPAAWTADNTWAFGMPLPFTWYSRALIGMARNLNLNTIAIIRSTIDGFNTMSGFAALEWARRAQLSVIGPTVEWCRTWAAFHSCRVIARAGEERCICGETSEAIALQYDDMVQELESMNTMYELNEDLLLEEGNGYFSLEISLNITRYIEGIFDDIRKQGSDPDLLINLVRKFHSVQYALVRKNLKPKMVYYGNIWTEWFEATLDGEKVLNMSHFYYMVSGGQWHPEFQTEDRLLVDPANFTAVYRKLFGSWRTPTPKTASCAAVGSILFSSQGRVGFSARELHPTDMTQRRELVREALRSTNNPDTIFGMVRFNTFGLNSGRNTALWQYYPPDDNNIKSHCVIPLEYASKAIRNFPTMDSRFGCPQGSKNHFTIGECVLCEQGKYNSDITIGFADTECTPCAFGSFGNLTGQTSCEFCPAGSFETKSGQSQCQKCSPGQYNSEEGSIFATDCLPCAKGFMASHAGQSVCQKCPGGTFSSELGQSMCTSCMPGRYRDPNSSGNVCEECSFGRYTDKAGQNLCRWCPAGTYGSTQSLSMAMDQSCEQCPPGKHSLFSAKDCMECPLGSDACPGGWHFEELNNASAVGQHCGEGYSGSMCEVCKPDWHRSSEICLPCSESNQGILWLVSLFVAVAFIPFATACAASSCRLVSHHIRERERVAADRPSQIDVPNELHQLAIAIESSRALKGDLSDVKEIYTTLQQLRVHARTLVLFAQLVTTWVTDRYLLFARGRPDDVHDMIQEVGKFFSLLSLDIDLTSEFQGFLICTCGLSSEHAFVLNYLKSTLLPIALVLVLAISVLAARALRIPYHPAKTGLRAAALIMYITFAGQVNIALKYLPAKGSNFDGSIPSSTDVQDAINERVLPSDTIDRPDWARAQATFSQAQNTGGAPNFVWRWRSDYNISLDSSVYKAMLPLIWTVFAFYCMALPVATILLMYKHRRQLNPRYDWARPRIVHFQDGCLSGEDGTAVALGSKIQEMPGARGAWGLYVPPFIASRLVECVSVMSNALHAACAVDETLRLEEIHVLRVDLPDTTEAFCLVGFNDSAKGALSSFAKSWQAVNPDPDLDAANRDATFKGHLIILSDFYSSYFPTCFFFEVVTIGRQLVISVFAKLVSVTGGAYICFTTLVMFTYLILLAKMRPYCDAKANLMQCILSASFLFLLLVEFCSVATAESSQEGYDDARERALLEGMVIVIMIFVIASVVVFVGSDLTGICSGFLRYLKIPVPMLKKKAANSNVVESIDVQFVDARDRENLWKLQIGLMEKDMEKDKEKDQEKSTPEIPEKFSL